MHKCKSFVVHQYTGCSYANVAYLFSFFFMLSRNQAAFNCIVPTNASNTVIRLTSDCVLATEMLQRTKKRGWKSPTALLTFKKVTFIIWRVCGSGLFICFSKPLFFNRCCTTKCFLALKNSCKQV